MASWTLSLLTAAPLYQYSLLFLLVVIEGPIITMGAGGLAFLGYINPYFTYAVIVYAEMASDCLYYALGFFAGRRLVTLFAKVLSTQSTLIERIARLLQTHSGKTIVIAKITHVAGVPFLLAAGMAKIRFTRFFLYDVLATIPKSLIFLAIGYFFGQAATVINSYLEYGTAIVLVALGAVFGLYIVLGKYVRRKLISSDL